MPIPTFHVRLSFLIKKAKKKMIFFFSERTKRQAKRRTFEKFSFLFVCFQNFFSFCLLHEKNCACVTPKLRRAALNLGLMGLRKLAAAVS